MARCAARAHRGCGGDQGLHDDRTRDDFRGAAEVALERRKQLLERARFLINERWPLLEDWAARHSRVLHWTPPAAGAICFFSYQYPIDSMPLVDRLTREFSTMIVPGVHFRAERHLRIGFGMSTRVLHSGLAAIDRLLTTID